MDLLRTPWSGADVAVPAPVAPTPAGLPWPAAGTCADAVLLACPWTGTGVPVVAPPALTGLPWLAPSLPVQRAAAEPAAAALP